VRSEYTTEAVAYVIDYPNNRTEAQEVVVK
jgi:hypothetical protein